MITDKIGLSSALQVFVNCRNIFKNYIVEGFERQIASVRLWSQH